MKTRMILWLTLTLLASCATNARVQAEQTVTVNAKSSDISEDLDLKSVANLFGEVKDLEDFETELNNPERHLSNLDLNGDGQVDYLRVIELTEDSKHLVVIQAVLAEDIYQDVATIYVEKKGEKGMSVQVIGDEYIYGSNYIIEPVYIYRPIIYDWFWGPYWTCWHSPYYWGYYPYGWGYYGVWTHPVYVEHIYVYHHDHCCCSYRYATSANQQVTRMRQSEQGRAISQRDYATRHAETSFEARNSQMANARDVQRAQMNTGAYRQVQPVSTRSAQGVSSSRQNAQRGQVARASQVQNADVNARSMQTNRRTAERTESSAMVSNRGFSVAGTSRNATTTSTSAVASATSGTSRESGNVTSANRTASTRSSQQSSSSMSGYNSSYYGTSTRSYSGGSSMSSGSMGGGYRGGVSGSAGGGSSRGR